MIQQNGFLEIQRVELNTGSRHPTAERQRKLNFNFNLRQTSIQKLEREGSKTKEKEKSLEYFDGPAGQNTATLGAEESTDPEVEKDKNQIVIIEAASEL